MIPGVASMLKSPNSKRLFDLLGGRPSRESSRRDRTDPSDDGGLEIRTQTRLQLCRVSSVIRSSMSEWVKSTLKGIES